MTYPCPKGHRAGFKCHSGPPNECTQCVQDRKLAEKKQKADFLAQQNRDKEQRLHDENIAEIEAQIAKENESLRNAQLAEERARALERRRKDLENAISSRKLASRPIGPGPQAPLPHQVPPNTSSSSPTSQTIPPPSEPTGNSSTPAPAAGSRKQSTASKKSTPAAPKKPSAAETEWKRQKQVDGAQNDAIDEVMQMGGLEKVKQKLLDIKAKVEVSQRQGVSLKDERFSASMLGNPGTGKLGTVSIGLQLNSNKKQGKQRW